MATNTLFKRIMAAFAPGGRTGGRIYISIVRPIFMYGQRVEAGMIVEVDAVDAAVAVGTKRAKFLNVLDAKAARDAVRAESARLSRADGFIRPSFWSRKSLKGEL